MSGHHQGHSLEENEDGAAFVNGGELTNMFPQENQQAVDPSFATDLTPVADVAESEDGGGGGGGGDQPNHPLPEKPRSTQTDDQVGGSGESVKKRPPSTDLHNLVEKRGKVENDPQMKPESSTDKVMMSGGENDNEVDIAVQSFLQPIGPTNLEWSPIRNRMNYSSPPRQPYPMFPHFLPSYFRVPGPNMDYQSYFSQPLPHPPPPRPILIPLPPLPPPPPPPPPPTPSPSPPPVSPSPPPLPPPLTPPPPLSPSPPPLPPPSSPSPPPSPPLSPPSED